MIYNNIANSIIANIEKPIKQCIEEAFDFNKLKDTTNKNTGILTLVKNIATSVFCANTPVLDTMESAYNIVLKRFHENIMVLNNKTFLVAEIFKSNYDKMLGELKTAGWHILDWYNLLVIPYLYIADGFNKYKEDHHLSNNVANKRYNSLDSVAVDGYNKYIALYDNILYHCSSLSCFAISPDNGIMFFAIHGWNNISLLLYPKELQLLHKHKHGWVVQRLVFTYTGTVMYDLLDKEESNKKKEGFKILNKLLLNKSFDKPVGMLQSYTDNGEPRLRLTWDSPVRNMPTPLNRALKSIDDYKEEWNDIAPIDNSLAKTALSVKTYCSIDDKVAVAYYRFDRRGFKAILDIILLNNGNTTILKIVSSDNAKANIDNLKAIINDIKGSLSDLELDDITNSDNPLLTMINIYSNKWIK